MLKRDKKGQVTLYLVIFIVAIVTVIIGSMVAPIGVRFSTVMYEAGEEILLDNNETIANINDATVRASIESMNREALSSTKSNIKVYTDIYKYSWIIALIAIGLIGFLYTRRLSELNATGFI